MEVLLFFGVIAGGVVFFAVIGALLGSGRVPYEKPEYRQGRNGSCSGCPDMVCTPGRTQNLTGIDFGGQNNDERQEAPYTYEQPVRPPVHHEAPRHAPEQLPAPIQAPQEWTGFGANAVTEVYNQETGQWERY
jgi:hypothetical protein